MCWIQSFKNLNNISLILLFEELPAQLARNLARIRNCLTAGKSERISLLENIDHFATESPKEGRALLILSPEAWLHAVRQYPNIRLFNYYGLTYEFVRSLNINGYVVDIADLNSEHFPTKSYDLIVGHGGRCRSVLENSRADALIYQYVSGAHWKAFNQESSERYSRFAKSRGVNPPQKHRRDLSDLVEGEEYLFQMADCLLTINCPRMIQTFGGGEDRFFFTGLGAYPDHCLTVATEQKDFEIGRNNFIYVGGTGGNIQKGFDVLLEAFAASPNLHLFIYCKVEDEILINYQRELSLPNIHYIHHLRYLPFRSRLKRLMKQINFSVHAPINSGMGTAFMGTMGVGLIPVGYVDIEADSETAVLCADWDLQTIINCISTAAAKDASWCKIAALKIVKVHENYCGISSLRARFGELFSDQHQKFLFNRRISRPSRKALEL